jgi:hypothetical protein
MKYKLICLFLFLITSSRAQVFELNPSDYYSFEPVFTHDYVVKNKIRSVRAAIVYKRDNEPIQDKGLCKAWEFNNDGFLTRFYITSVKGFVNREVSHPAVYRRGRKIAGPSFTQEPVFSYDTIFTTYFYNQQKQIILRRTRDGDYYNAVYYEYDTNNQIAKQRVFRETNASEDRNEFKLGVQNLLSVEEFHYEKIASRQTKRKHLNDEGKVYKETILNYDSVGHLLEENNSYTVSWMRASTKMTYDEKGRLKLKQYTSNENGDESTKNDYKYIAGDLLDVENRYKGDIRLYEFNYLYDKKTNMLTSHFVREELNKAIVIVKYSYDYY